MIIYFILIYHIQTHQTQEVKYLHTIYKTNKNTGPYSTINKDINLDELGISYECGLNVMQIFVLLYVASVPINHIQNMPRMY